jgi:uncharacterized protein YbaR (Trm112 family)
MVSRMNEVRSYHQKVTVSPETMQKLRSSRAETIGLSMRDINCPFCGYLVERVFSDISGHKMIFCKKCKEEYPVNLGYFRRMKRREHHNHSQRKRQSR